VLDNKLDMSNIQKKIPLGPAMTPNI
jgi:hypothetical protein